MTVLVDSNGIVHGFDFFNPDQRTYAITRFFNIVIATLDSRLFNFPQPH